MKKGNAKKDKTAKMYNDIAISLAAWELIEGEKCDRLRCSAYAGKDAEGSYNPDVTVNVYIKEETDTDGFEFDDKRTRNMVDVVGQIAFGRYKDSVTVSIFADKISSRK